MASGLRWVALSSIAREARAVSQPGSPSLGTRLSAIPNLIRDVMSGQYHGTSPGRLGLVALALLYVISPADLFPEGILPLIGLADDAFVIAWIASTLNRETESYLTWDWHRRNTVQSTVVRR